MDTQQEQQQKEDQKGVSLNDLVNSFRDAVYLKNRLNEQLEEVNAGVSKTIDDLRTSCDHASEDAALARVKLIESLEHIMHDFAKNPDKYMRDTTPKIEVADNVDYSSSRELVVRLSKFISNLDIVAIVKVAGPDTNTIYTKGAAVGLVEISAEVKSESESGVWVSMDLSGLTWEAYGYNVLSKLAFFFAAIFRIFQDEILPDYIPNAMYEMNFIWSDIRSKYWRLREHAVLCD